MPKSICERLQLPEKPRERVIYTVKTTQYHNDVGNIAILGDAAHSTYPSLAAGYNTGLQDVGTLIDCIRQHNKPAKEVLSDCSNQRVPVGRALVNFSSLIAYSPFAPASSAGTWSSLKFVCRALTHKLLCGLAKPPNLFLDNDNVLAEYASGQKPTVQLAEEWTDEINLMNTEMQACRDATSSSSHAH